MNRDRYQIAQAVCESPGIGRICRWPRRVGNINPSQNLLWNSTVRMNKPVSEALHNVSIYTVGLRIHWTCGGLVKVI